MSNRATQVTGQPGREAVMSETMHPHRTPTPWASTCTATCPYRPSRAPCPTGEEDTRTRARGTTVWRSAAGRAMRAAPSARSTVHGGCAGGKTRRRSSRSPFPPVAAPAALMMMMMTVFSSSASAIPVKAHLLISYEHRLPFQPVNNDRSCTMTCSIATTGHRREPSPISLHIMSRLRLRRKELD